jgi:hypothetical protein
MQTTIYYGLLNDTKTSIRISFVEACRTLLGRKKANRLTVAESTELRRRLGEGEVIQTRGGFQIWLEER